jgi:hypothetical protein
MFDFDRMLRKFRRAVRARFWVSVGALNALAHLHDWAEYQKAQAAEIDAEIKGLFEGTDDRKLYLVIGSALTAWASMEESLVLILSFLLRTESEKAGLILYSTINFSVWLSIIDELFAIDSVHSSLKPRWNKLAERLRRLKDSRDRIAHHAVHKKDSDASIFEETTLRPSAFDLRQKSLKYKPMSNDDILDFTAKVVNVARGLLSVAHDMADQQRGALPDKSSEATADPPPADVQ